MAIVATAICTRSGAIVLSRAFLPVNRQRIETLLSQFPRLLQAGQQHTYVENEEVRFIYQPLEVHYLVMITSKASNILQDMDTLSLLSRVVSENSGRGRIGNIVGNETESFRENALEILLAFDEIVAAGQRENINLTQLHTILAMESQEEAVQEIIAKNKMQEAKEIAKRKIKQMDMEKKEAARRNSTGKGGIYPGDGYSSVSPSARMTTDAPSFAPPTSSANNTTTTAKSASTAGPAIQTMTRAGKGMKLVGKKTNMMD